MQEGPEELPGGNVNVDITGRNPMTENKPLRLQHLGVPRLLAAIPDHLGKHMGKGWNKMDQRNRRKVVGGERKGGEDRCEAEMKTSAPTLQCDEANIPSRNKARRDHSPIFIREAFLLLMRLSAPSASTCTEIALQHPIPFTLSPIALLGTRVGGSWRRTVRAICLC